MCRDIEDKSVYITVSNFKKIIEENYKYIDKTKYTNWYNNYDQNEDEYNLL